MISTMEHRFLPEVLKSQEIISELGLPVTLIGSDLRLEQRAGWSWCRKIFPRTQRDRTFWIAKLVT